MSRCTQHVFDAEGLEGLCLSCGDPRTARAPLEITDFRSEPQRRRAFVRWHGNARPWTLRQAHRRNLLLAGYAARGLSSRAIGQRFGISHVHVCRILHALGFAWTRARGWFRALHASVVKAVQQGEATLHRVKRGWKGRAFRRLGGQSTRPRGRPQPTRGGWDEQNSGSSDDDEGRRYFVLRGDEIIRPLASQWKLVAAGETPEAAGNPAAVVQAIATIEAEARTALKLGHVAEIANTVGYAVLRAGDAPSVAIAAVSRWLDSKTITTR